MGGRKAEADAIRRKLADAKAREEAKISQKAATEKTAKRKAEEAAEEQEREQRKQAKTEGGPAIDLAASASAAAKGQVSDVKVDLGDKQQMELAMAYASGTASAPSAPIFRAFLSSFAWSLPLVLLLLSCALRCSFAQRRRLAGCAEPMVNMAVNSEWWKGTGHASGPGGAPASAAADALSNGLDVRLPSPPSWLILVRIADVSSAQVTAGNRNTQIAARPEFGPGSGAKDWKCNGMRCTGEWNYGNAEKCRKCGRLKGL